MTIVMQTARVEANGRSQQFGDRLTVPRDISAEDARRLVQTNQARVETASLEQDQRGSAMNRAERKEKR